MDIIDIIKRDHRRVEVLFSEIETTRDTQKLYDYFNQLYEEINIHAEVEARVFYPVVVKLENMGTSVELAYKEHDRAKQMLEELESFSPTSEEFAMKIRELKQLIQYHVRAEENDLLALIRLHISEENRLQLGVEFEAIKNNLQGEMSVAS